jgi:hypothetical protein
MATARWIVPGLIASRERCVGMVGGVTGRSQLPAEPKHEYSAFLY